MEKKASKVKTETKKPATESDILVEAQSAEDIANQDLPLIGSEALAHGEKSDS